MRFMVLVPADDGYEQGRMPSTEELAAMTRFNEELVKAGVMLAGEGLHPSAKGAKVRFEGGKRTVTDGPFTEAKELIGGYWIPDGTEIQLRQVFEDEDFDDVMTPELREAQSRLREQTETR
jgi:hypothetical protein